VEQAIGSREWARLRVGVGPLPAGVTDWAEYVLAPFVREERAVVAEVLPIVAEAVECWIAEGIEPAMGRFNKR